MVRTYSNNNNPSPAFGSRTGGDGSAESGIMSRTPMQVAGLIPLICCDPKRFTPFSECDCREWADDDCYINPVFGDSASTDPLKNDKSAFLIDYPFYYQYQWSNNSLAAFTLEKYNTNSKSWSSVASLNNHTLGTYYNFTSLCISNWKGYRIEWKKVLSFHGEGLYRFKVNSIVYSVSSCLVSPPFCLKQWSCESADKTVKWEANIFGGRLGSIDDDKKVFMFCCSKQQPGSNLPAVSVPVNWYDSVRHYGFFGYEKTSYERVNFEYLDGTVNQHKNEAIQSFEYHSAMLPKYLHDRFKAYGIMADELKVSDYNWSNSDYEIDQRLVVCDGGYEPSYTLVRGENATRLAPVTVNFKEGRQNVIRDKCCHTSLVSTGKG